MSKRNFGMYFNKKWYSLRVISGKEKSTKDNILFEADAQDMSDFIDDILLMYDLYI